MAELTGMERVPQFGREIRDTLFFLDKEAAFTNHGSFGTVPKPVHEVHVALLREVDRHPDQWFRESALGLVPKNQLAMASFVGVSPSDIVVVENATTGVNTILRSCNLGPKDGVLITSHTYGACVNAAVAVCKDTGATLHSLEIKLPVVSKESIIEMYRKFLEEHQGMKLVLVDHITSASAMVMPVKEITEVCHSRGVRVMIDGAHAPGQLELNITDIGADYYTGNLHKWVFCPRGCALLYVREELQEEVCPLVVSHWHFQSFQERFLMQATRDYTPYTTAATAIEFYKRLGGLPAISSYNQSLISWATEMLCQRWQSVPLPVPLEMRAPFMSLVSLPECLGPPTTQRKEQLKKELFQKYNVSTVVELVDGKMWCRISTQVYNTKEDYLRLADAMAELIKASHTNS